MTFTGLFLIFAWIAIVALALSVFSEFWFPMLIGAVILAVLAKLVR